MPLEIPTQWVWGGAQESIFFTSIPDHSDAPPVLGTNTTDRMTTTLPTIKKTCFFNGFHPATHPQISPGLPAQAKKHAESAKNTLLTWKRKTASDKERKGILEALVMLYYTLGVACLLQNRYPVLPSWVW